MGRAHPYWECPPLWQGQTGIALACGPSLRGFDVARLDGHRVLPLKDSVRLTPAADFMFFCDNAWFDREKGGPLIDAFAGEVITLGTRGWGDYGDRRCHVMKQEGTLGLSLERDRLTGSWSVLDFALNVLFHLGCPRILLLGADMQVAADGATHWHEGHELPHQRRQNAFDAFQLMMGSLAVKAQALARVGIEVINCTPGSRLTCFPQAEIGDFL